jgi:tetratricopeptide (TPR) repeat protein
MLRRICKSYRNLAFKSTQSIKTSADAARKITDLIETHQYIEASEELTKMLSDIKNYKGTKDYNEVLQIQANCLNFSFDYKSAEQNFLNIIQYIKAGGNIYKPQDLLDAKLDLLQQYICSNLKKIPNLIEEIKKSEYNSATEEDKALLQFYEALYHQLTDSKEDKIDHKTEAKKKYIDIINYFPNQGPIRYYALHNMVVMNWQTLETLDDYSDRLLKEIQYVINPENASELQVYISQNLRDVLKSNLSEDHISYVAKDFIICLYVMGGLYGDFSFEALKQNIPKMLNAGIPTILAFTEILLQRKATREIGREFLEKISENMDKSKVTSKMKLHLLYGAYNLDKKNYDDAIMYLKEATKSYLQPWHEYDKAAAHQFIGLAYQKKNDMENSVLHSEEALRIKKKIIPWHRKMSLLQVPPWRHVVKQQERR